MARLFDSPLAIVMILLVVVLLFGAPKLPGMARSLGQSMRILKSEVGEMKEEAPKEPKNKSPNTAEDSNVTVDGKPVDSSHLGTSLKN